MNLKLFSAAALACAALAAGSAANADTILLFNTGVAAGGTVLTNGSPELHYVLASAPGGADTDLRVATSANGFPIPPWLGDDGSSAWIGPQPDGNLSGPSGDYDYRTTFTLDGLNPFTASIVGQWSTDNAGVDILINGHSTGQSIARGPDPNGPFSFQSFTAFQINSGFVAGVNTIDFIVNNEAGVPAGQNPTGLRVELSGTASAAPEPASWALMILGFGGIGASLRTRRRAAVAAA